MSTNQNTKVYVFTEQQLKEHDLNIAKAVHDASVKHTARQMVKMNSGQQIQSMTNKCKNLNLPDFVLEKLVDLSS